MALLYLQRLTAISICPQLTSTGDRWDVQNSYASAQLISLSVFGWAELRETRIRGTKTNLKWGIQAIGTRRSRRTEL